MLALREQELSRPQVREKARELFKLIDGKVAHLPQFQGALEAPHPVTAVLDFESGKFTIHFSAAVRKDDVVQRTLEQRGWPIPRWRSYSIGRITPESGISEFAEVCFEENDQNLKENRIGFAEHGVPVPPNTPTAVQRARELIASL